jgi:peptide/nickel transport system substrate-binding protein
VRICAKIAERRPPAPVIAAAVLLSAVAIRTAAAPLDADRQTLRIGAAFLNQHPDPVVNGGLSAVSAGLAETLFKLNDRLLPDPWLARDARPLDARNWQITLRPGVRFQNGAPMNASAVKASLERDLARWAPAKTLLDIARIAVQGDDTLTLTTNQPSPMMPALLTDTSTAIVDAAAAERMGDAFSDQPVLTGPFSVERFDFNRELVAVRNTNYWGPPAKLDRVVLTAISDDASRVRALERGEEDIIEYLAPASVAAIRRSPDLRVVSVPSVALEFMYFNQQREPWRDARVRLAITAAIDRDALTRAVMGGEGAAALSLFPPELLSCPRRAGPAYDPASARRLLADAGYRDRDGDGLVKKDGRALSMTLLTYRQRPELPAIAASLAASLKAVGVRVEVRTVEQIRTGIEQGDWDGALWYNTMGMTGEPYQPLSLFYATAGRENRGGYSNPRVDALVRQMGATGDRAARQALGCRASELIADDAAVVPLIFPKFSYGVSRAVEGFQAHPIWIYLVDAALAKR